MNHCASDPIECKQISRETFQTGNFVLLRWTYITGRSAGIATVFACCLCVSTAVDAWVARLGLGQSDCKGSSSERDEDEETHFDVCEGRL